MFGQFIDRARLLVRWLLSEVRPVEDPQLKAAALAEAAAENKTGRPAADGNRKMRSRVNLMARARDSAARPRENRGPRREIVSPR